MRVPSGDIPLRSESGRIPATIGPYRVQREIGRGAAGVVYSVTRDGSEGTYALKLIRDLEGIDEDGLVRFQREAQLSSRLDHPGVVGALDAGAVGRHRYLVLPYVEGESLAQRLRRERALPPEDAATLIGRVADALAAVHAAGVVHRDIKPDNILLDQHQGGAPRLTDFGIAREGHGRGSLTQSSAFLGTPAYMAPEQIQAASRVDGKADVYSLASVLYECLSGLPPFQGATTFQIADQVLHGEPPHLSDVAPEVPRSLVEACHAALSKEPEARPDAASFAELLHASVLDPEPPQRGRGIKAFLGLAVAIGLTAVGASITFAITSTADASPSPRAESASPTPSQAPPRSLAVLEAETLGPRPLDPRLVEELRALSQDPEQVGPSALVLGDYLIRRGDLPAAEEALRLIPESAAEWRRAALLRSRIMFRLGRIGEGDALEADLLLTELEDPVGKLIRARRLMVWKQIPAGLELLRPSLKASPPDRVAVLLALKSRALSELETKELLISIESDPVLLANLGRLQSPKDAELAKATFARAEALCAPRACAPAMLERALATLPRDGSPPPAAAQALFQRLYEIEPSTNHLYLFLAFGKPAPEVRQQLSKRLRRQSPIQFAWLLRRSKSVAESFPAMERFADPFCPGDESWSWARDRVSALPPLARRHAFRALTAAIGGTRSWDFIANELSQAVRVDGSSVTRGLAAEICIRRGRLTDALRFARTPEVTLNASWRGRLKLYRSHEAAALEALREGTDQLCRAELALALGKPEEALEALKTPQEAEALKEPSVEVRLARFEAYFALEQKADALAAKGRSDWQIGARLLKGEYKKARVPIHASLARVQAQIGSLDFRLGLAYGLFEIKSQILAGMLPGNARDAKLPVNPVQRAVYYAGEGSVPSAYFLRRALFYSAHEAKARRQRTLALWGSMMLPLIERALENEPDPGLDIYLALLDRRRGLDRVTRARQLDPEVRIPDHLLPLVDANFPNRRALFGAED